METTTRKTPGKTSGRGRLLTKPLAIPALSLLVLVLPWHLWSQTEPSALLELQSTGQGFLLPRMTEAQREAIVSPATGLIVFNTTTSCLDMNFGTPEAPVWQGINCRQGKVDSLDCSGAVWTGSLTPGQAASGVSVNVPYTGGNGGPHPGQVVSSIGVSGLTAVLAAGNLANGGGDLLYTITGTPSSSGSVNFALNIGGQACTSTVAMPCGAYVAPNQWKVFQCHNLGSANTAADPFTPSWEINGEYWQWGRLAMAAAGPTGPASGDANAGAISGWNTSYAPNGAWSDSTKTANDPCPAGFRVPTNAQWDAVLLHNTQSIVGTWTSSPTNYSSGRFFGPNLMLPAAGYRSLNDGSLFYRGDYGYCWSSTEYGSVYAWSLFFFSGNAYTSFNSRSNGFSVRCAAE